MSDMERLVLDGSRGLAGLLVTTGLLELRANKAINKDRWCKRWLEAYAAAGGQHVARGSSWKRELALGAVRAQALELTANEGLERIRCSSGINKRRAAAPLNSLRCHAATLDDMWWARAKQPEYAAPEQLAVPVLGVEWQAAWERLLCQSLIEVSTLWATTNPIGVARALFMCLFCECRSFVRVDAKVLDV